MRSFPSEMLKIVEGCEFEICLNEFPGVWQKAIIEAESPAKPKATGSELCFRLLNYYDSLTPITALLKSRKLSFRPVPPKDVEAQIDVKQGCIVDAFYRHTWGIGTFVKEIDDAKCVLLMETDSEPDLVLYEKKFVRPHLDWVDEKWWVIPGQNEQFLRQLKLEPMFCPGAMVEVMSKLKKEEVVWFPAMLITEIEEVDEKKYIVKFGNNPLCCLDKPEIIIDLHSVRPSPAPFSVEDYLPGEDVEVFHGEAWHQGKLKRRMDGYVSFKRYRVLLEATKEELTVKHSNLRPLMKLQEDGIWKHSRETTSTQGSGNKMRKRKSVMNEKDSDPPESASSDIADKLFEGESSMK